MRYAKNKKEQHKRECVVIRRCGGCKRKARFKSSGKFRVNANGRRLDVWLIYRCDKCGRTLNIPIYERISPEKLEPELYAGFLENDRELVERFARDREFFKGLGYELKN